ncbi:hypothetical protein PV327_011209, partial [Microctonus hyperodae]
MKHNCKHVEERIKRDNPIVNQLYTKHPETSRSNELKSSISQHHENIPHNSLVPVSAAVINNINDYDWFQKTRYETSNILPQFNCTTQIFPYNLEMPDQRHIDQDYHDELSNEEYDTDINSGESDTSNVVNVEKSLQSCVRVLAEIIPVKVTKESIMIQEALLLAMKKAYEEQEKMNSGCKETFK